jgi:hypothetical protein
MNTATPLRAALAAAAALPLLAAPVAAHADVVTDWNARANDIVNESKLGTPPAVRVMAVVQTAVAAAVQGAGRSASIDAAVAAANRATLARLLPAQQASIDKAYDAALAALADTPEKAAGIAAGERAAAIVLTQRAKDTVAAESYRPATTAGAYVPTAAVAAPTWSSRTPWVMSSAAQFRVPAPPSLDSDAWARDYDEVKEIGARASARRSAEQTEIARFWEYSLPAIYHGAVRSVANQPGRDAARNARLFAAVSQAMDDGLIAVLDSKYHYHFWRPATAIRNGDIDGHDATLRDPAWASLVDAPLHPEYPSAHAVLAGAVGVVLKADAGTHAMPMLATSSPTAKGATRRWTSVDDFVREVGDSRIYAGIHYRFSVDAGTALGQRIGELAVGRLLAAH